MVGFWVVGVVVGIKVFGVLDLVLVFNEGFDYVVVGVFICN